MRNLIKRLIFPILSKWYLRKTKKITQYKNHGISLKIYPNVFHPGMFLSTNILIEFLKTKNLADKTFLELGAGSGMISFFAAKNGCKVTATDINESAINGLKNNRSLSGIQIEIIPSDLFQNVLPSNYEIIIINPPYYPYDPQNDQEIAFYCGEDFDYFKRLFLQLKELNDWKNEIFMILSQDCEIKHIKKLGNAQKIEFELVYEVKKRQENNFIFQLHQASV